MQAGLGPRPTPAPVKFQIRLQSHQNHIRQHRQGPATTKDGQPIHRKLGGGGYLGVLQDSSLVAAGGEGRQGIRWGGAGRQPPPNTSLVCPSFSAKATTANPAWNILGPPQLAVRAAGCKKELGTFPSGFWGHSPGASYLGATSHMLFALL